MGVIECVIHGLSSFLPLCVHLTEDLSKRREPRPFVGYVFELDGFDGLAFIIATCRRCAKDKGVDFQPSYISSKEWDLLASVGDGGACILCFEDYLNECDLKFADFLPSEHQSD